MAASHTQTEASWEQEISSAPSAENSRPVMSELWNCGQGRAWAGQAGRTETRQVGVARANSCRLPEGGQPPGAGRGRQAGRQAGRATQQGTAAQAGRRAAALTSQGLPAWRSSTSNTHTAALLIATATFQPSGDSATCCNSVEGGGR